MVLFCFSPLIFHLLKHTEGTFVYSLINKELSAHCNYWHCFSYKQFIRWSLCLFLFPVWSGFSVVVKIKS